MRVFCKPIKNFAKTLVKKNKKRYYKGMKVKVKNNLKRFFILLLGMFFCTFSFLSGCGPEPDESFIECFKILRRPTTYDFDVNSATPDYYQDYAYNIIENLARIYGVLDVNWNNTNYKDIFTALDAYSDAPEITTLANMWNNGVNADDHMKYFYDAIRFQVVSVEENNNGTPSDTSDDYYIVQIDPSRGWNWGFELLDDEKLMTFYDFNNDDESLGRNKFKIDKSTLTFSEVSRYYSLIGADYLPTFAGSKIGPSEYEGDRSAALGYALYCIVLDLPVHEISSKGDGSLTVEGFDSPQDAYNDLKQTFGALGTYVGLTEKNKTDLKQYILDNVIGASAKNFVMQNMYYDEVVDAVVEYCATLTPIGDGEQGETVGDIFSASEIIDMTENEFMITPEDGIAAFPVQTPYEYQSFVIVPQVMKDAWGNREENQTQRFSNLWLDLYYEARDKAGNIISDPDLSLTLSITINWFDGMDMHISAPKEVVLKNGVYDPAESSTICFDFDEQENLFGRPVPIEPLDITALNVNHSHNGEDNEGKKVIVLDKATPARKYYEVKPSRYGYGSYAVLRSDMIGQPYLEAAFDIKKTPGDTDRNYDFYMACSQLYKYSPDVLPDGTIYDPYA